MMVGTDQHIRPQPRGLANGSPGTHVHPVDELQVPAVTDRQLNGTIQAAGRIGGRGAEPVDELADGFSLHAPSVGTGRTTWQGVQALTHATAYADCGVGRRLRGEAGDEDRD